jgi:hypothetical protein
VLPMLLASKKRTPFALCNFSVSWQKPIAVIMNDLVKIPLMAFQEATGCGVDGSISIYDRGRGIASKCSIECATHLRFSGVLPLL